MITILQMLNAKQKVTAAYTPQQNEAIERVHCDENMKMLLQSIEINDEEALDWAVHAYNATIDKMDILP
jgi:transposase InsO family protein